MSYEEYIDVHQESEKNAEGSANFYAERLSDSPLSNAALVIAVCVDQYSRLNGNSAYRRALHAQDISAEEIEQLDNQCQFFMVHNAMEILSETSHLSITRIGAILDNWQLTKTQIECAKLVKFSPLTGDRLNYSSADDLVARDIISKHSIELTETSKKNSCGRAEREIIRGLKAEYTIGNNGKPITMLELVDLAIIQSRIEIIVLLTDRRLFDISAQNNVYKSLHFFEDLKIDDEQKFVANYDVMPAKYRAITPKDLRSFLPENAKTPDACKNMHQYGWKTWEEFSEQYFYSIKPKLHLALQNRYDPSSRKALLLLLESLGLDNSPLARSLRSFDIK